MKKYLVTYDLNRSGQNYYDLIEAIKTYPCIRVMQSAWFIKSSFDAKTISFDLQNYMDKNDHIIVSEITSNRQGWLSKSAWDFLKS